MNDPFCKSKSAGEGIGNSIGPEAFACSAVEELQTYLSAPLKSQTRWQEKLHAPYQRLLTIPNPTEAQIREAQKAYEVAFAEVTREIESAGKAMTPQQSLQQPLDTELFDVFSNESLPLAHMHGPYPFGDRIPIFVPVAAHIFLASDFRPDGNYLFTQTTTGREPTNVPFFGGINASTTNGRLFLHNAINTDPIPGAGTIISRIWAGVGVLLIPQSEKGQLRIRTHVPFNGTGQITLPPSRTFPLNVRADNTFSFRMVVMSTPVSNIQWRTELDQAFIMLSQGWTGAGGRPLGGTGYFNIPANQAPAVSFDRAGGTPRLYAIWVIGEDEAICGSRPEVINSINIAMNCTVVLIRVDELVRRFIYL